MSKFDNDYQNIKNDILREINQSQFQQRQEILKLQQMIIDREDKSKEMELKVNSFDNKMVSLKNLLMSELSHTKENLLQEPKKIMRDFEINVKHIYDMKFKSLEAQFIGIMDEQSKLNRLTQLDQTKRQEEIQDYYSKLERFVQQNQDKLDHKLGTTIQDILAKFNKMEDTFLELFKQKEKLFERMNLGYEHLFSNQEIIESTIKKIIYTLDRKADNLSVRTYLKNIKIDLDTKFEDFQNSLAFPRGIITNGTYLQDKTNQSAVLENLNTINISELKPSESDNQLNKIIYKINQQNLTIKNIKENYHEHEKRIDHLEEITMNLKLMDQNSQVNQLLNLKQRVPVLHSDEYHINQTPNNQKGKFQSFNHSPQIDNSYYQNIPTDSKSIHQKSDIKDRDQFSQNKQGNSILNEIFGKKNGDNRDSKSNQINKSDHSRNLIYEAFDQTVSPQQNKLDHQKNKNEQIQNNLRQNNFMQAPSSETIEKNEKLPQQLEQDEGEQIDFAKSKLNNQNESLEKLKLVKSVAQDRMTSTNVQNRMRLNFDQKQKLKSKEESQNKTKKEDSDILKEAQPLDQGFIDVGEDFLTNSLKKSLGNKDNDTQKSNNQNKRPQLQIEEVEQMSYKNKNNNQNIKQTVSPPPEEDQEELITGGGIRNLLNKSKNRNESKDDSPIKNSQYNKKNVSNFSNLNEIDLLNQEYKNQFNQSNIGSKSSSLDNKFNQNKVNYQTMQNNSNLYRQGEYYDQPNSQIFENPLDKRNPLLKKQGEMSNSSIMRGNKSNLSNKQNDLPPLNIKSTKEINKSKVLPQRNQLNKGLNQQGNLNNKFGNQYQNRGPVDQNNQYYEEDEEVVYQIDEDGFLMDEAGEYLRDEQGNFIRLTPDQLDNLRDQNLVVEEEYY
ncbi:endo-1,4-beta-xylanase xylA, putative (macronuclear) [Tetrahymena thermophila SB210]|uniref:Endo-1,4-beta-xylanase xylA, putative n=1 Tax=Tetrahymena thermophila (strain SB210) TaxID=312017 RepID=I7LUI3_TETTS|nr:endo-1,4-beta-xylanase xylA, putative [Tetrahymena thermophila SB210]EAR93829.2 endo-1,4-beta-xylanase xylA, putative [Tetrahymena thermophila SB210]|eukprot:XP_001014074.2 endo-1,4-beta-xylanase xylA, putative [Tetrahymena thermophila SB210]